MLGRCAINFFIRRRKNRSSDIETFGTPRRRGRETRKQKGRGRHMAMSRNYCARASLMIAVSTMALGRRRRRSGAIQAVQRSGAARRHWRPGLRPTGGPANSGLDRCSGPGSGPPPWQGGLFREPRPQPASAGQQSGSWRPTTGGPLFCLARWRPRKPSPRGAMSRTRPTKLKTIVVTGFRASLGSALDGQSVGPMAWSMSSRPRTWPTSPTPNLAESISTGAGRLHRTRRRRRPSDHRARPGPRSSRACASTASEGQKHGVGHRQFLAAPTVIALFDFNVFASRAFSNSITVRKTASAETEEGSLGATVDLQTGRPFDYSGANLVLSGPVWLQ